MKYSRLRVLFCGLALAILPVHYVLRLYFSEKPAFSSPSPTILYWGWFYDTGPWRWVPNRIQRISCLDYLKCTPNANGYHLDHWSWTWEVHKGCHENITCMITTETRKLLSSQAVVFHPRSAKSAEPPSYPRPRDQLWIYYNLEPPHFAGHTYSGHIFNWTMTYIQESDIFFPYARIIPGRFKDGYDPLRNYLEGKTKSVLAMTSNCAIAGRLNIMKSLSEYTDVEIRGGCIGGHLSYSSSEKFFKSFKFYLSFESVNTKDYLTEKFYINGLGYGMVPVVLTAANLSDPKVAPPGSYIDATKFKTAKELAEFLTLEGSDPVRYNKYFQWYSSYTIIRQEVSCTICEALHRKGIAPNTYSDVHKWFKDSSHESPYWTLP